MGESEAEGSGRTSETKNGSHESGGSGGSWEQIISNMVVKIETVSSHFSYTEEYVMDHTPEWVERKYWQALKEQWEKSQARVLEGFKSFALLIDSVFNKGANYSAFIQDSFEEAMSTQEHQKETESRFVQGQWWQQMNDG